jgi:putative transposase
MDGKQKGVIFWSDRYHSTLIQSGEHFGKCLFYIDLNMIRAGVVKQPGEWQHTAYHELTGKRKRYRVIDMERLLNCLMMDSLANFQRWYKLTLAEKVAGVKYAREAHWSEAVAVGDPDWLKGVYKKFKFKNKKIRQVYEVNEKDETPMVGEPEAVYYIEG